MNENFDSNNNATSSEELTNDTTVSDIKKSDEITVEESSVEEAPVEEAPVEEAPVEESPVEEAPVEEAPVEKAPVEEAPVEREPVTTTTIPPRTGTPEQYSYGGFSQKWNYEKSEEKIKKGSGNGIKIFAIVMAALLLITVTAFITYVIIDNKDDDKAEKVGNRVESFENPDGDEKDGETSVNAYIEDEVKKAEDREEETVVAEYTGEVLTRQQLIEFASPSVVGIKTKVQGYTYFGTSVYEGVGSGFIITESGYIVTNHHVIKDAMAIKVILENGNEYEATLVGSDELSDLAVLKIEPSEDLHAVVIGNSDKVVAGDSVIAIGCPSGIELSGTATSGMVSKAKRELSITDSYGRVQKTMFVIQIDAPINPGNSGGPLLNDRGEVIGINTLKLSSGYEGIGFSLPINGVMDIVNQLCENGVVSDRGESSYVKGKAALGITYNELTEQQARYYQVPRGVLVILATPGGAAQQYGVKGGDIITGFNDVSITVAEDLVSALNDSEPGEEVTLTIWRDGDTMELKIVLGESS